MPWLSMYSTEMLFKKKHKSPASISTAPTARIFRAVFRFALPLPSSISFWAMLVVMSFEEYGKWRKKAVKRS